LLRAITFQLSVTAALLRWAGLNDACALHQTLKVSGLANPARATAPIQRRRGQCTVQVVARGRQHTSATSPRGRWLSGVAHPSSRCYSEGISPAVGLIDRGSNTRHGFFQYLAASPMVQRKVSRCFVFNGLIFVGSMGAMRYAVLPSAAWLLRHTGAAEGAPVEETERLVRLVEPLLVAVYNCLWLYPAYVVRSGR
jgi:hypothetical protein